MYVENLTEIKIFVFWKFSFDHAAARATQECVLVGTLTISGSNVNIVLRADINDFFVFFFAG